MKTTRRSFLAACAALFLPMKVKAEKPMRIAAVPTSGSDKKYFQYLQPYPFDPNGRGENNPLFSGGYADWQSGGTHQWRIPTR